MKNYVQSLAKDGWLNEKEAQALTGRKTTTLWKLRKQGKVKTAYIGKSIYYSRESMVELLNAQVI